MASQSSKRPVVIILVLFTLIVVGLVVAIAVVATQDNECEESVAMPISSELYGKTANGEDVHIFTLTNKDCTVKIIDFGGIITNIQVPDKNGAVDDVVLGYDSLEGYLENPVYFGAIIGRFANRIAGGKFTIDGVTYNLTVNNGHNALHGGPDGFQKRLWQSKIVDDTLVLTYVSADGEEHYPGEVTVTVTYKLTAENELVIDYNATTTKPTIINLTSHSYFNLAGQATNSIDDQVVKFAATQYTPKDETNIPIGTIESVSGTAYDMTNDTRLGDQIPKVPGDTGFDHTLVLGNPGFDKHVVRVTDPGSGRSLDMYSTEPSVHFYTAYYIDGVVGKGGLTYTKYGGFCLEAQHYPDSPNKPEWPSTVLRPGDVYKQTTKYVFGVKKD